MAESGWWASTRRDLDTTWWRSSRDRASCARSGAFGAGRSVDRDQRARDGSCSRPACTFRDRLARARTGRHQRGASKRPACAPASLITRGSAPSTRAAGCARLAQSCSTFFRKAAALGAYSRAPRIHRSAWIIRARCWSLDAQAVRGSAAAQGQGVEAVAGLLPVQLSQSRMRNAPPDLAEVEPSWHAFHCRHASSPSSAVSAAVDTVIDAYVGPTMEALPVSASAG